MACSMQPTTCIFIPTIYFGSKGIAFTADFLVTPVDGVCIDNVVGYVAAGKGHPFIVYKKQGACAGRYKIITVKSNDRMKRPGEFLDLFYGLYKHGKVSARGSSGEQ